MEEPENQPIVSGESADLRTFIDRNADAFLCADGSGSRWSRLCWPGALVPIPWFLYRKMYALAALATLLPVATSLIFQSPRVTQTIATGIGIMGLNGKRLYLRHARSTIDRVRSYGADDDVGAQPIRRAGGVSVAGGIIGTLILLAGVATGVFVYLVAKQLR